MQQKKLRIIAQNQTSTAKRVLEAVPMTSPHSVTQICSMLTRRDGNAPNKRVVEGCLHSLADDGLLKENPRHYFQRIVDLSEEPPEKRALSLAQPPAPADTTEPEAKSIHSDDAPSVRNPEPLEALLGIAEQL